MNKSYYFVRLLARLLDLLLVSLCLIIVQSFNSDFYGNPLVWYLAYNFLTISLNGQTLGKYSFTLIIKSNKKGLNRIVTLLVREVLMLLLLPILAINLLFVAPIPLHDRISGTKVIRNES